MKKLKFEPEDFKSARPLGMSEVGCIQAASIAGHLFDEWYKLNIENAPTVYGVEIKGTFSDGKYIERWFPETSDMDTHKAKLIDMQEIKCSKQ